MSSGFDPDCQPFKFEMMYVMTEVHWSVETIFFSIMMATRPVGFMNMFWFKEVSAARLTSCMLIQTDFRDFFGGGLVMTNERHLSAD